MDSMRRKRGTGLGDSWRRGGAREKGCAREGALELPSCRFHRIGLVHTLLPCASLVSTLGPNC
eukprot:11857026-Karenia_brevis.AAC.1